MCHPDELDDIEGDQTEPDSPLMIETAMTKAGRFAD